MIHFKDFLLKLQTLDIKVNQRNKVIDGQPSRISFYDISHENPYLSALFKNELKELKELAVTDILNLPREQIILSSRPISFGASGGINEAALELSSYERESLFLMRDDGNDGEENETENAEESN